MKGSKSDLEVSVEKYLVCFINIVCLSHCQVPGTEEVESLRLLKWHGLVSLKLKNTSFHCNLF